MWRQDVRVMFDSQLFHFCLMTLGKWFTHVVSLSQSSIFLALAKGRRCSVDGKVLADSLIYDHKSPAGWVPRDWYQLWPCSIAYGIISYIAHLPCMDSYSLGSAHPYAKPNRWVFSLLQNWFSVSIVSRGEGGRLFQGMYLVAHIYYGYLSVRWASNTVCLSKVIDNIMK